MVWADCHRVMGILLAAKARCPVLRLTVNDDYRFCVPVCLE